ncbi:Nitrate/nitrite sensor protein NarX [Actinomadura rubteroloni]|uniref:histidine kinase n=1 Tax=Actinomadura rubteroloni TaxID=1926885 RepID=A0A2P4URW5_9ACTN|nr:sensor histidine kinase [Actinomadura rubteroloni]POM27782.1 Nitrate/nitrite sensor protein NarX [Actinomadura rubteroloni]
MSAGIERSWLLPADLRDDAPGRRTVRDWCADLSLALLSLCVAGAVLAGEHFTTERPAPAWFALDAAVGVLAPAALLLRRRWPLAVALALVAAYAVARTAGVPAGVAAFGVALRCRTRTAVAVATLLACANVLDITVRHPGLASGPLLAAAVLLCAAGLAAGLFARARRDLVVSLRDRAIRAESEQRRRAGEARRAERARLAREMHDVLAHRISVMSVHAGALAFRPGAPADQVARTAEILRAAAHDALVELREVIGVLRDDGAGEPPGPPPTLAAARALIDDARRAGTSVQVESFPDELPAAVGRDVCRILEEALTNARKHAPGRPVTVAVEHADDGVRITVRNPLRAAPDDNPIPGGGFGLIGVAERVELAGGRLDHGPRPDGTFTLSAWLPSAP